MVRLFLIITILFLSAYLLGCDGGIGACEVNLNLKTNNNKKSNKSFCYENSVRNECNKYTKEIQAVVESRAGNELVVNAGCTKSNRVATCTMGAFKFYVYKNTNYSEDDNNEIIVGAKVFCEAVDKARGKIKGTWQLIGGNN